MTTPVVKPAADSDSATSPRSRVTLSAGLKLAQQAEKPKPTATQKRRALKRKKAVKADG